MYTTYPLYYTTALSASGIYNVYGPVIHEPISNFSNNTTTLISSIGKYEYSNQYTYVKPKSIYRSVYIEDTTATTCTGSCTNILGFNYSTFATSNYRLYQIYSYNSFVYAATSEGLEIYNYDEIKLSTKYLGEQKLEAKTIYGNGENLYIGTTSGIYWGEIKGNNTTVTPMNLSLDSNNINYIHGNTNSLFITTTSGVEYFNYTSNPTIHSKTALNSAGKCFLTHTTGYYFSTTSGTESLNSINTMLCDWSAPSYSYVTGSGIFQAGLQLTDMYITEGTAKHGGNTIFCTTSSGVYVIDEDSKEYSIYYTRN